MIKKLAAVSAYPKWYIAIRVYNTRTHNKMNMVKKHFCTYNFILKDNLSHFQFSLYIFTSPLLNKLNLVSAMLNGPLPYNSSSMHTQRTFLSYNILKP